MLADRRHCIPGIENVRDSMLGEAGEILRDQPVFVAHFDRVRPALRQFAQKSIKVRQKVLAVRVIRRPEA